MSVLWYNLQGEYLGSSGPENETQYNIRAFVSYTTPPEPPEPDYCCPPPPIPDVASCPPASEAVWMNSPCAAGECRQTWEDGPTLWNDGAFWFECEEVEES